MRFLHIPLSAGPSAFSSIVVVNIKAAAVATTGANLVIKFLVNVFLRGGGGNKFGEDSSANDHYWARLEIMCIVQDQIWEAPHWIQISVRF